MAARSEKNKCTSMCCEGPLFRTPSKPCSGVFLQHVFRVPLFRTSFKLNPRMLLQTCVARSPCSGPPNSLIQNCCCRHVLRRALVQDPR